MSTIDADSIYFLMFPGWKNEFRGNRWHYASRWARHLPVTLVQPTLFRDEVEARNEEEPRIHGCRILHVAANPVAEPSFLRGLLQTRQLLDDMECQGYRRPILWAYDPDYSVPFLLIPTALRVYHATENYYDFPDAPAPFLSALSAMVGAADLVVAVSGGVAVSYSQAARVPVEVVTNGCDHSFYAEASPDIELEEAGREFEKVVIYGGNINNRLDLDLVAKIADDQPGTLFAFVGRVAALDDADKAVWQELRGKANFRHFGPVPIARLPGLYAAAHVGIAPYKLRPDLTRNLFPLKIFEMLSTGLPVVTTPFDSLADMACPALHLVGDEAAFTASVGSLDRRRLSAADREVVDRLSRAQDYDLKFEQVRQLTAARMRAEPSAPIASGLGMVDRDAVTMWLADCPVAVRCMEPKPANLIGAMGGACQRAALNWGRRNLPQWLKASVRRMRHG